MILFSCTYIGARLFSQGNGMKTCFIGHRKVWAEDVNKKLDEAIKAEYDSGCRKFIVGTHGNFDHFALYACKRLRKTCNNIDIEVVITSLNAIKKRNDEYDPVPYADVKTVMYEIEEAHFKQQIILSNRQMIDECDVLICYVDTDKYVSGAKRALRYAEKKGLKIINLFNA